MCVSLKHFSRKFVNFISKTVQIILQILLDMEIRTILKDHHKDAKLYKENHVTNPYVNTFQ